MNLMCSDGDDGDDDDDDDDDIYIMMKCVSVCLSATKNNHFLERHQGDV